MGLYDMITVGEQSGQVKCWDSIMRDLTVGSAVPEGYGSDYTIAMREGGFVNVRAGHIESWTEGPAFPLVIDKYGGIYDPDSAAGIFGESY